MSVIAPIPIRLPLSLSVKLAVTECSLQKSSIWPSSPWHSQCHDRRGLWNHRDSVFLRNASSSAQKCHMAAASAKHRSIYGGKRIKDSAPGMAQSQTSQSPWPTCARFELPFTGGQVGTRNSHTALQQDGNQPPARKVKAMLGILTGHTRGQKVPKGVNMTGLTALGPLTHFCAVERKILLPATSMETLWA